VKIGDLVRVVPKAGNKEWDKFPQNVKNEIDNLSIWNGKIGIIIDAAPPYLGTPAWYIHFSNNSIANFTEESLEVINDSET